MIVTRFTGGKTDVFPAAEEDWPMPEALHIAAADAPGREKGEAGFVVFAKMRPGTDVTVAELNLERAKQGRPPLAIGEERIVRTLGYRNYAHVEEVTAFGIDYDEFQEEQPNWDPAVWPCDVYAHSTHSYEPLERPGKWRAILPLAVPIPIARELAVRRALQRYLPRGAILRAPHQPAFLPTCAAGDAVHVCHVKQTDVPALLDWRNLEGLDETETVHASGEAGGTLLGAEFDARGLIARDLGTKLDVVCPWAHEHKSGGDLGYLYFSEDGLGKFGCAHGACQGRGSAEVYALWNPDEEPASPAPEPLLNDTPKCPVWLTGAALAEPVPAVDWLVRDLELAPGRCPILAADSGSGKSWSVQSIALSVATGKDVFARFPCRKGAVFHVAEDSDVGAVLDRYQKLARGMGASLAELDLAVYTPRFRVTTARGEYDPKPLAEVMKTAAKHGAALVIIDSLATVCVGLEENSPEIALPLYDSRHGTLTVLWTHHTNKAGENYRGSSALKAAAGSMWAMAGERDEPRVWTNTKHAERTERKDRLDSFQTTWDGHQIVTYEPEDTSREERAADRISKEILTVMERGAAATKSGILELVGGQRNLKYQVFEFLVYSRVIEHVGSRYIRALGVPVPRVPDETIFEVSRAKNAHRKTQ